ncbi:MAG: hypothetical protein ACREOC_03390 [Gemmatimonadales bacterium]
MSDTYVASIPRGYWVNGACCREAVLREPTGEDQAFLTEAAPTLLPAQWATEVLARCLTRLGTPEPVTRDAVRSLSVGDREALLLQLRRLTSGDRLQCLLTCPSPDCGEELDLDLKVSDLLLPCYGRAWEDGAQERHEVRVRDGDAAHLVRFRLPTGSDHEAAALLARTDLTAAADLLLRRCVESVVSADGVPIDGIPEVLFEPVSTRMAELDPQAELTLRINCPACGRTFAAVFDAASYLFQELQAGMRHLYHEVHLLAFHYHWNPSEILGMSSRMRRRYLELLEEELSERGSR